MKAYNIYWSTESYKNNTHVQAESEEEAIQEVIRGNCITRANIGNIYVSEV